MTASYPIRFSDQLRQHLRALRKKRGLTQAGLGALLGVSQARIAEIEANPGLVSLDQLMQVFAALGVGVSLTESAAAPAQAQLRPEDETHSAPPVPARRSRRKTPPGTQGITNADREYTFNMPPDSQWDARLMRAGPNGPVTSMLVEEKTARDDEPASSRLEELRRLNPDKDVHPASARSYLLRPRKGSW